MPKHPEKKPNSSLSEEIPHHFLRDIFHEAYSNLAMFLRLKYKKIISNQTLECGMPLPELYLNELGPEHRLDLTFIIKKGRKRSLSFRRVPSTSNSNAIWLRNIGAINLNFRFPGRIEVGDKLRYLGEVTKIQVEIES